MRPEDLPQASIFHAQSVEDYAAKLCRFTSATTWWKTSRCTRRRWYSVPLGKLIELRSRFVSADASTVAVEPCHRL